MGSRKKYTCKDFIIPSGCVIYTGQFPEFVDIETVDCDATLDDAIEIIGGGVISLIEHFDLTDLFSSCIDFDASKHSFKELQDKKIEKLCEHEKLITQAQEDLEDLKVGDKKVKIDLSCFVGKTPDPCSRNNNLYSVKEVLSVFSSVICISKKKLSNCCCEDVVVTSGTSGTSGGGSGTSGESGVNGTTGTSGESCDCGTSGTGGGEELAYYLADEYECGDCITPVREDILVNLPSSHTVQVGKFYLPVSNPGFVYTLVNIPQSPASSIALTVNNFTTCFGACSQ